MDVVGPGAFDPAQGTGYGIDILDAHLLLDEGGRVVFLQVANDHFLVADVGEKQGLHRVDVPDADAVEFGLEHIEETPVKAFDQACQFDVFFLQIECS